MTTTHTYCCETEEAYPIICLAVIITDYKLIIELQPSPIKLDSHTKHRSRTAHNGSESVIVISEYANASNSILMGLLISSNIHFMAGY